MKIKAYYCRHCGQFRSKRQVHDPNSGVSGYMIHTNLCNYCNREVIDTALEFKKWLDRQEEITINET